MREARRGDRRREEAELERLAANARACAAPGTRLVGAKEITSLEPDVKGIAALFCPDTGIVDPVELTRSLLADAEDRGAMLVTRAEVTAIGRERKDYRLQTSREEIRAAAVVNAAGLRSDEVAAMAGVRKYRIHPWRGITSGSSRRPSTGI